MKEKENNDVRKIPESSKENTPLSNIQNSCELKSESPEIKEKVKAVEKETVKPTLQNNENNLKLN